jgi:hypothetical protein
LTISKLYDDAEETAEETTPIEPSRAHGDDNTICNRSSYRDCFDVTGVEFAFYEYYTNCFTS